MDAAVTLESAQHNDIIRGSFYDSYDTLTNKVMWGFEYSVKRFLFDFCLKVGFYLRSFNKQINLKDAVISSFESYYNYISFISIRYIS